MTSLQVYDALWCFMYDYMIICMIPFRLVVSFSQLTHNPAENELFISPQGLSSSFQTCDRDGSFGSDRQVQTYLLTHLLTYWLASFLPSFLTYSTLPWIKDMTGVKPAFLVVHPNTKSICWLFFFQYCTVAQPYASSQTWAGRMNQQISAIYGVTYREDDRSMVSVFQFRLLERP